MAFVATAPDEPVTSDVSAGGAEPAVGAPSATRAVATPIPTPEPTAEADTADPSAAAAGVDETVVDTEGSATIVDSAAVVPEDFVPSFVSEDLTDTGAHTSATPAPAPSAPPATPPAAPASSPPAASQPTAPAQESAPPPSPTPTPAPATPEPEPETEVQADRPARGEDDGRPSAADWAALRDCESGGNYGIATGNGYFGAYQFSQATWDWVASLVRPDLVGVAPSDAAPGDQDALAFALYDMRGAAPWPTCGVHLR